MSGDSAFMYRPPRARAKLAAVTKQAERVRRLERASPLTVARAELHAAMRKAHQDGATLEAIGHAAGVTRQRVHAILNAEQKSKR